MKNDIRIIEINVTEYFLLICFQIYFIITFLYFFSLKLLSRKKFSLTASFLKNCFNPGGFKVDSWIVRQDSGFRSKTVGLEAKHWAFTTKCLLCLDNSQKGKYPITVLVNLNRKDLEDCD